MKKTTKKTNKTKVEKAKKTKGSTKSKTKQKTKKTEQSDLKPFNWKPVFGVLVVIVLILSSLFVIRKVGEQLVGGIIQSVEIIEEVETKELDLSDSLVGYRAPTFSLPGNKATSTELIDLLENPLIVVFWASWQPTAVDQLRVFDQYLENITSTSSVNFIFINQQEEILLAESFLRRSGYDLEVLFDENGSVGNSWQVHTLPTTYLVGRDGFVKEKIIGGYSVEAVVDKLLNINR